MIRLREKDLIKLADLVKLPLDEIKRLHELGIFDESKVIDSLIRSDYNRTKASRKYRVNHIVDALMDEYQVSRGKVMNVIYNKTKKRYFCPKCGRTITKAVHDRNNGICDSCIVKSIQL